MIIEENNTAQKKLSSDELEIFLIAEKCKVGNKMLIL